MLVATCQSPYDTIKLTSLLVLTIEPPSSCLFEISSKDLGSEHAVDMAHCIPLFSYMNYKFWVKFELSMGTSVVWGGLLISCLGPICNFFVSVEDN